MKLRTKEEEEAHNRSVFRGGAVGGLLGLTAGAAGIMLASRRYMTIRNLTLPMKTFLVTSSATFVGIVAADNASRNFSAGRHQENAWYETREQTRHAEELSQLSTKDRILAWAKEEKYKIVVGTWMASMVGSFVVVSRNRYLTGPQKIVQARVYAQGLTVAVLCATAGFEIADQKRGRGILQSAQKGVTQQPPKKEEHNGSSDVWKDMVAAEESRMKLKHQSLYSKQHEEENVNAEEKEEGEEEGESGEKGEKGEKQEAAA